MSIIKSFANLATSSATAAAARPSAVLRPATAPVLRTATTLAAGTPRVPSRVRSSCEEEEEEDGPNVRKIQHSLY